MRTDRQPLFVALLACAGFVLFLLVTIGPVGVGPGRPLELVRRASRLRRLRTGAEACELLRRGAA